MENGNKPKLPPSPPKPRTYFYLKHQLYYERIEGGAEMPDRLFLSKSQTLLCDKVLTNSQSKVITGLRKCDVSFDVYLGDVVKNGGKSFIWIQCGKDADTGLDSFNLYVYPNWMPADGCEYLKRKKRAAERRMLEG